ncbi:flagellar brake protein [Desulfovibrio sp. OttesenSCG-928-F07]|nr:flagellar brake protein [Desulfovibrio sp. OttesenSCG-928-F07]
MANNDDALNTTPEGKMRVEHAHRLDLSVGGRMLLRFGFSGESTTREYTAELTGYSHYEFILVRMQPVPGLNSRLTPGSLVNVRFLHNGAAATFQAEILSYVTKPAFLLFLSYPNTLSTVKVRKHQRLTCALPVTVRAGSDSVPGIISDISLGGCRLVMDMRGHPEARNLQVNDRITLSAQLTATGAPADIGATIKNIEHDQFRLRMGLSFADLPEQTSERLEQFLDSTQMLMC